ncbi:MAG TPA: CHASE2 domain-containing protein [Tepidisphaeraceae bacterium]|nr:CHASE2 domain-containing protein [Tepidisphaeraceae bacterium]
MTRSERRLLVDTSTLGIALTFLVTFLDFSGLLSAPERFFYDFRARRCQNYTPPPTTQLVHIDIDDNSILALGHWPWPRSKLAEIVDEIRIGGAKTMVLDIILSEPNPYELESENLPAIQSPKRTTLPATKVAATQPATLPVDDTAVVQLRLVNNDQMLAKALKRFKTAVVPLSLSINAIPNKDLIYLAMVDEMSIAPWTKPQPLLDKLINRGFKQPKAKEAIAKQYTYARNEGMFKRIALECGDSVLSYQELRRRILPRLDPQIGGSVTLQVLREQHDRFAAVHAARQFAVKIPQAYPKLIDTREELATLEVLSKEGWTTGFFDFVRPADGTVRFIPLLANHHGYAYPQLGLALACATLNVRPTDLIVTKESITIPCQPNPIVIPVHSQETYRGSYDLFIDIPWFGPPVDSGWQRMYDWPDHKETTQHLPVQFIWDACDTRHKIAANNKTADAAMMRLVMDFDRALLPRIIAASRRDVFDPASRFDAIELLHQELNDAGYLKMMRSKPRLLLQDIYARFSDGNFFRPFRLEATDEEKNFIEAFRSLRLIQKQNVDHQAQLEKRRAEIRERIEGKAALIG